MINKYKKHEIRPYLEIIINFTMQKDKSCNTCKHCEECKIYKELYGNNFCYSLVKISKILTKNL